MRQVLPNTRGWIKVILILFIFLALLWLLRNPILTAFGSFLSNADDPQEVEALFVLGGSPVDRSLAAAEYFNQGLVKTEVVCTGANVAGALAAFDIRATEAEMSSNVLKSAGIPESRITELPESTSTFEEAEEILQFSKSRGLTKIGVLSSDYHLRRVSWTFNRAFEDEEISIVYFSADSKHFNPEDWWKNEEGFLTCFSEYAKLCFYLLNH